jgi:hypothetical protein
MRREEVKPEAAWLQSAPVESAVSASPTKYSYRFAAAV